jgi:ABC-type branched-subunit amino acid transport system substrate-binding protein
VTIARRFGHGTLSRLRAQVVRRSDALCCHRTALRSDAAHCAGTGPVTGEEYFALDHSEYGATIDRIMSSGTEVVFNTTVPPGLTPFLTQLHDAGFTKRGGQIVCTYFDENFLNMVPAAHVEGLYSCLDYYQTVREPFSRKLLLDYRARFPAPRNSRAGAPARACIAG